MHEEFSCIGRCLFGDYCPRRGRLIRWIARNARCGGCRWCPEGGLPALSPADLAFCFLSCPYPPSPLPLRGRGCPKVYFAGGFAPGTPALDRSRHLQSFPNRHPSEWRLFTPRVPAAPAGANAPFEAERTGFPQAMPVPRPFSPRGCKGRSPLHKKAKNLPLPAGKGGGGMGAESKLKAAGGSGKENTRPRRVPQRQVEPPTPETSPPLGAWFASLFQCRPGSAPGDARGEAPCIRKLKISPFPVGEGGWGDGGRKAS